MANKSIDKLLIVLTEGEIPWDNTSNIFLNAEIEFTAGHIGQEIYAKNHFILICGQPRTQKDLSLSNPIFKKEVLKLAAHLHNKEPKDLAREEVAAHRKMIRIRNVAIAILVFLFIAAIAAAWLAFQNAKEAIKERNNAQANYLASEAQRQADERSDAGVKIGGSIMKQNNSPFISNIAQAIYRKNSFYRIIATLQKTSTSYNSFTTTDFSRRW